MNHLIHRVSVELRAPSRTAALAAQEATSRALQHDLAAVESVLNIRFPEQVIRRVDRLELDLGPLPIRGFRQAFVASLVNSLNALDAEVMPTHSAVRIRESRHSARKELALAGSEGAVQAFLHYVVHGWLPWFFSVERWREEVPGVLLSGAGFSAIRSRLPPLVLEEPARLQRLLPFPRLVTALFASKFGVEESTAGISRDLSPTDPTTARLSLALWYLRLMPKPAAKREDAKTEKALLDLLAEGKGGVLSTESDDTQPVVSVWDRLRTALARFRETAKSPEVARLSKLITRERKAGARVTRRFEFAKPRGSLATQDLLEIGVPTESAGIVLLHPFLVRFFQVFGWLDDRLRLLEERRWQAVHALRWIVHKNSARDDVELVFEKALCGISLSEVARWPTLEPQVASEAESLLRAVIGHWKALKDTSPDGLREAFLARPGLLYFEEPPRLHVETRGYDVLLSRLPWSFDHVVLPWLRSPIQVRWAKPS